MKATVCPGRGVAEYSEYRGRFSMKQQFHQTIKKKHLFCVNKVYNSNEVEYEGKTAKKKKKSVDRRRIHF